MSIEAMKQAIEAWDACGRYPDATSDIDRLDAAINALRTAIQQAEAQQPATGEPVKSFAELREKHRAGIDAERAKLDATSVPVVVQHRKPVIGWKGETIGYTGWRDGKGLDGWPHRDLYDHPAPSAPKDHQIAALVNKVRDIARMFHDHQSLRERIAIELVPALKASQEVKSNAERWRYAIADGGNQSMNFMDIFDDWDGDGDFVEVFDAARLADKKGGAQ